MDEERTNRTPRRRRNKPDWAPKFLKLIRKGSAIIHACVDARIARSAVYLRLESDMEFKRKYDEAIEYQTQSLITEAFRRGRDGVEKPVFYKGDQVALVREYSDSLLMFLIRGRDPQYRDSTKMQLSGDPSSPIQHQHTGTIMILPEKEIDGPDGANPTAAGAAAPVPSV